MARPKEFDREEAVAQAMQVFWEQGYEATSIQDLTRALGLKPGSLYNAFHDKHSLFLETLACYQQQHSCDTYALLQGPLAGKQALELVFEQLVARASQPNTPGCFMVNSAAELAAHDPQVRAQVEADRTALIAAFEHSIRAGQAAGDIPHERDPYALATFLVNAIFGFQVTAKVSREPTTLRLIAETTLRALD